MGNDHIVFKTYHEPVLDVVYHCTVEFIDRQQGYNIQIVVKSFTQDHSLYKSEEGA